MSARAGCARCDAREELRRKADAYSLAAAAGGLHLAGFAIALRDAASAMACSPADGCALPRVRLRRVRRPLRRVGTLRVTVLPLVA